VLSAAPGDNHNQSMYAIAIYNCYMVYRLSFRIHILPIRIQAAVLRYTLTRWPWRGCPPLKKMYATCVHNLYIYACIICKQQNLYKEIIWSTVTQWW
jgi:hypothetical protein